MAIGAVGASVAGLSDTNPDKFAALALQLDDANPPQLQDSTLPTLLIARSEGQVQSLQSLLSKASPNIRACLIPDIGNHPQWVVAGIVRDFFVAAVRRS
jgi:hypothetical protein